MKEKPILFSVPMVRAILAGTKTQTRRIVKHVASPATADIRVVRVPRSNRFVYLDDSLGLAWIPAGGDPLQQWPRERIGEVCPYGVPGDRLWIREAWALYQGDNGSVAYRADAPDLSPIPGGRWRASRYMPRWASRITLEVTDVRVERLQSISEEDARAEGVTLDGPRRICPCETLVEDPGPHIASCPNTDIDFERTGSPILDAFSSLWNSINAKRAPWSSNPWVWAVSFKRVTS